MTVQKLETLCPMTSVKDAGLVTSMMDDQSLFPSVRDDADRRIILSNLLECRMIPSLYTFIETLKYFEPCVQILRSLVPSEDTRSVRQALFASYFRPNEICIEYAMHDTRPHPSSSVERDREIGYQQLWLYALRNFPAMTEATPKKDSSESQQLIGADPLTRQRFGALAVSLGFRTEAAEELAAQDGEYGLAAQLVNRAEFGGVAAQEATQQIADILRNAQRRPIDSSGVAFAGEQWLPRERRCGRPFDEDHDLDRRSLFLPVIYAKPDGPIENVSTLYCKSQMICGFLGIQNVSWTRVK
jgi:hypothetical protein